MTDSTNLDLTPFENQQGEIPLNEIMKDTTRLHRILGNFTFWLNAGDFLSVEHNGMDITFTIRAKSHLEEGT